MRWRRIAWWCVALVPLAFVAAILCGQSIDSALQSHLVRLEDAGGAPTPDVRIWLSKWWWALAVSLQKVHWLWFVIDPLATKPRQPWWPRMGWSAANLLVPLLGPICYLWFATDRLRPHADAGATGQD